MLTSPTGSVSVWHAPHAAHIQTRKPLNLIHSQSVVIHPGLFKDIDRSTRTAFSQRTAIRFGRSTVNIYELELLNNIVIHERKQLFYQTSSVGFLTIFFVMQADFMTAACGHSFPRTRNQRCLNRSAAPSAPPVLPRRWPRHPKARTPWSRSTVATARYQSPCR